jgi:DNA-binding transcriptional LysR family regulator
MTGFAMEVVRSVLIGELNLGLVMAPPQDSRITAAPFAHAILYAALLDTHPAAHKESLVLEDLAKDQWILFAKRVHPLVYETIIDTARRNSIIPKHAHNTMSPQQAVDLVSERVGVAILAEPPPQGFKVDGVVIKPLSDASLQLETCVVMRADDDSRLVNEYGRAFLRRYSSPRLPPKTESSSASRVLNWKTTIPDSHP